MPDNNKTLRIGLWKKKSKKGDIYYGAIYQGKAYNVVKNQRKVSSKAPDLMLLVTDLGASNKQSTPSQKQQSKDEDMF